MPGDTKSREICRFDAVRQWLSGAVVARQHELHHAHRGNQGDHHQARAQTP